MDSFRLHNFRSFLDTDEISLKKYTIIVGKNSSGKSSLLRFLPLLKQSTEAETDGPLLWYSKYVDFGSMKDVSSTHSDAPIGFGISIDDLRFTAQMHPTKNAIKEIEIIFFGAHINISFGDRGEIVEASIDEEEATDYFKEYKAVNSFGVLPFIQTDTPQSESSRDLSLWYANPSPKLINNAIKIAYQIKTKRSKQLNVMNYILRAPPFSFEHFCMIMTKENSKRRVTKSSAKRFYSVLSDLERKDFHKTVVALNLPRIFMTLNTMVRDFSEKVYYIGPSRALAKRYYRIQNTDTKRITHTGDNIGAFLHSLSKKQLASFSDYCKKSVGFSFNRNVDRGHVSIMVTDADGGERNIVDSGFGYSQILPILAQNWAAVNLEPEEGSIVAIEQPELHLHPHQQAKIADSLHNSAGESTRFIIETHSEPLINRFGQLVQSGKIENDDISIIIVNKDKSGISTCTKSFFSEDGCLESWPFGFFDA